jgi:hypothetical protein
MVLTLERSIEAIFLRTQISFKAKCSDHQDRYSSLVVYHPEKMISRKSDGHIVQWMSNQTLCYVGIMSVLHLHYVFSTISTYRMTSVVLFLAEERIFLFTGASWLALGLIWFPVDSAMGKAKSAWIWPSSQCSLEANTSYSFTFTPSYIVMGLCPR